MTRDRRGRAVTFTEFFAAVGLRRADSAAVDVEALIARANAGDVQEPPFAPPSGRPSPAH